MYIRCTVPNLTLIEVVWLVIPKRGKGLGDTASADTTFLKSCHTYSSNDVIGIGHTFPEVKGLVRGPALVLQGLGGDSLVHGRH